jgi:phytoene synthase
MSDPFAYCETFLRAEDKERYLATLFAAAAARPALHALYAFDIETARVAQRVHEPLAGEIRLQWWLDALSDKIPEQAAGHPVAAAFLDTIRRFDLPWPQIETVIEARRARLYEASPLSRIDVLERFARDTAGTVFALAGRILNDGRDPHIASLCAAAALVAAIDAEPRMQDLAPELLAAARGSLDQAHALIGTAPDHVLPAFLPLALANARLTRMEHDVSPIIPQWRRQWILWRASKDLGRHLAP